MLTEKIINKTNPYNWWKPTVPIEDLSPEDLEFKRHEEASKSRYEKFKELQREAEREGQELLEKNKKTISENTLE